MCKDKGLHFLTHIIKSNSGIPRVLKRLSLTQSTISDAVHTEIIPEVPIPCLWHYAVFTTVAHVVEIYCVVA